MLQIIIPECEVFDEETETFSKTKGATLNLEHSLVSISKWESKWHKAFLGENSRSHEETLDYVRCMTINNNVDPEVYNFIPDSELQKVIDYIQNPMTATWFSEPTYKEGKAKHNSETITSELIYYWMITLQIPVQFEKWHLNRLMTLIKVCELKNTPPKKMNPKDILSRNKAMNAARKRQLNTNG